MIQDDGLTVTAVYNEGPGHNGIHDQSCYLAESAKIVCEYNNVWRRLLLNRLTKTYSHLHSKCGLEYNKTQHQQGIKCLIM